MFMSKAVVLLSGGLDSSTCLAIAKKAGYEVIALSFDYHQRHNIELDSAKKIAAHYNVARHIIIETNMEAIGGSALTDQNLSVPDGIVERSNVPITYVPARNLIFLSYALSLAEATDSDKIYIGVNSIDYSGYPDCRPEFIEAFDKIVNVATKATAVDGKNIAVETPLLNMSKKEIVTLAEELGVPLKLTRSCYKGGQKACGVCDSCRLRLKGFADAGYIDPIEYETTP